MTYFGSVQHTCDRSPVSGGVPCTAPRTLSNRQSQKGGLRPECTRSRKLSSPPIDRHSVKEFSMSDKVAGVLLAAFLALSCPCESIADSYSDETSNNIPSVLNSTGEKEQGPVGLGKLLKGEKGKEIQACTRKCLPACLRGGEGAPGLGPMTLRRELVVFKEGFRDRKYCLTECTTACALSFTGDRQAKK